MGIFIFRALIDCRKTDFFAGSWRQLDRWENSACLCARAWKAAALPTVDVPHSFSCHCFSGGELGERSALLSSFLENRWCVRDPAETYLRPHTPATSSITAAALLTKSKRRGAKGGLDREEEPTIGLTHWEAARPPALFNTLIYLTGPWTSPGVQKCCLSRFLLPFKLTASSWTVPRIIQQANRNTQSPLLFSSEFRPWWPEGHWVLASVSSYQPLSVAVFSTGCARFPPFSAEDDAGGGKPVTTGAVLLTIQQRVNRDERIASGRGFGGKRSAKWGVQCWFSFFRWGRHTIKTWSGCSQPVQFF